MISAPYCYEEPKPSDDEDEHHIEKNRDDRDVEFVNQYMTPSAPEFEVISVDDQYECNY
jgi:hypothetical protein